MNTQTPRGSWIAYCNFVPRMLWDWSPQEKGLNGSECDTPRDVTLLYAAFQINDKHARPRELKSSITATMRFHDSWEHDYGTVIT